MYAVWLVLWALLIVIYPRVSNVPRTSGMEKQRFSKEGLYSSSLTEFDYGMLGFQLFETREGQKHWNIRSRFAELNRKDSFAMMRDVHAEFFAAATGNVVFVTSRVGKSYFDRNWVELEGEVQIRSAKGFLFEMDSIEGDSVTQKFQTKDHVNMSGPESEDPRMKLSGDGMIAFIGEEHFFLEKNVTGNRRLASKEWLRITSATGEFFAERSTAIFKKGVHAFMPNLEIRSDVFELEAQERGEKMAARGRVKLKSQDKNGQADRAFVEVGTNRIVLDGNARLLSGKNDVQGSRIVIYQDEDRVEVEQASGKVDR